MGLRHTVKLVGLFCKVKLEAKARRSLLQCFSEKGSTSFGFKLCFGLWKMSLQVGQAVK